MILDLIDKKEIDVLIVTEGFDEKEIQKNKMEKEFSNINVKSQKCDKDSKEIITFFYKSPLNIEIENLPEELFSKDGPNEENKYNLLKFKIKDNITGLHVHGPSSRTSKDYKDRIFNN